MFAQAIEKVSRFIRPVYTIRKRLADNYVLSSSATLFFVNNEGCAITCKHVVGLLIEAEKVNRNYSHYKAELGQLPQDEYYLENCSKLKDRYNLKDDSTVQIKSSFQNCVEPMAGFFWHLHPDYDLAVLQFKGFDRLLYQSHAVFLKNTDSIRQGDFLCRLGFPFPEFSNFSYNQDADEIEWTDKGTPGSPMFPVEGMVTRFMGHNGVKFGIELSTPGLIGQSGGPLFDRNGIIYGMQFQTKSLHLGFDVVDAEVMVKNRREHVSDYAFMHLGNCIHVDIIKDFLRANNIRFDEQ